MILTKRHWLIAGVLAVGVHAGVAGWLMWSPKVEATGMSDGDGEFGQQVGLGSQGALAAQMARMKKAEPEPVVEPEPEPEPKPKPKPKPKPVEKKLPEKKEAPKPEKKPVLELPKPEAKPVPEKTYKVEQKQPPKPEPPKPPEPEQPVEPVEEVEEKPAVAEKFEQANPNARDSVSSEQMNKRTGNRSDRASGGKRGKAKSYIADLNRWLNQHQEYPPKAKKKKIEGVVKLQFAFDRDGYVLSSRVYESSGSELLDQAALDMLQKASPLPLVPKDFYPKKKRLSMVIPVEYSLITD